MRVQAVRAMPPPARDRERRSRTAQAPAREREGTQFSVSSSVWFHPFGENALGKGHLRVKMNREVYTLLSQNTQFVLIRMASGELRIRGMILQTPIGAWNEAPADRYFG